MPPVTSQDLVGRMFVCHTKIKNHSGETILNINEGGEIREVKAEGVVRVRVNSRPDNPTLVVALNSLRIGAPKSDIFDVKLGIVHVTSLTRLPPGSVSFTKTPGDIRKHFSALLTGVYEIRNRLPLKPKHIHWIKDDATIKDTCTVIRDSIRRCSPKLEPTLARSDFTIDDVITACKPINKMNHTAGGYVKAYSDFRPGTEWYGDDSYVYDGQSNDVWTRQLGHDRSRDNPNEANYNFHHYHVARAARKCKTGQLFEQSEMEGGSQELAKGLRDLTEQMFILLLNTYSQKAMNWRERTLNKPIQQAVAEQYGDRELCIVYSEMAQLALQRSGFAQPGQPGRAPFGAAGGLNYTSPLGGEHTFDYEKTTWVVEDHGDKWVYHRSSFKLSAGENKLLFRSNQKAGYTFEISAAGGGVKTAFDPAVGDEIYTSWEVMKPGSNEHPVPYFRNPTIGCYKNWSFANKLGFKAIWKRKADGKWFARYYQQAQPGRSFINDTSRGSWSPYALGVALYAFFTRASWPDKQSFVPDYGRASLIEVKLDRLQQNIKVNIVTGTLARLEGPAFSLDVPRDQMKTYGFENVNGKFRGYTWDWLEDPNSYVGGKVPAPQIRGQMKARRKKCDWCWMASEGSATNYPCDQVPGTERCKHCVLRGLPCSWSSAPKLFGIEHNTQGVRRDGVEMEKRSNPTYDHNRELLFKKPVNEEACTAREIPDPGFRDVKDLE